MSSNKEGERLIYQVQVSKKCGVSRDELDSFRVPNITARGFAERLVADDLRSDEDALAQVIGTGIELFALPNTGAELTIALMRSTV